MGDTKNKVGSIPTLRTIVSDINKRNKYEIRASIRVAEKIYDRAIEQYDPTSILSSYDIAKLRIEKFYKDINNGLGDLNPDSDLVEGNTTKPTGTWEAYQEVGKRLEALKTKAVLDTNSKPEVRVKSDQELIDINRTFQTIYETNFSLGNDISVSGLTKADLFKSASIIHEELELRDMHNSESPFYKAVFNYRAKASRGLPRNLVVDDEGLLIPLEDNLTIKIPNRISKGDFQPEGNNYFLPTYEYHHCYSVLTEAEGEIIGELVVEKGVETNQFSEYFLSGVLCGRLLLTKSYALIEQNIEPFVLSQKAVAMGWVPQAGSSCLPSSLEVDTPPELRFWNADDPKGIRDDLVGSGILKNIQPFENRLRRIDTRLVVDDSVQFKPLVKPEKALTPTDRVGGAEFMETYPETPVTKTIVVPNQHMPISVFRDNCVWTLKDYSGYTFISRELPNDVFAEVKHPNIDACSMNRAKDVIYRSFNKNMVDSYFDLLCKNYWKRSEYLEFCNTLKSLPNAKKSLADEVAYLDSDNALHIGFVKSIHPGKVPHTALRGSKKNPVIELEVNGESIFRLSGDCWTLSEKQSLTQTNEVLADQSTQSDPVVLTKGVVDETEERFILGIVLEPEVVDAQADIYSAEEIRKAAHDYMENARNLGIQHKTIDNTGMTIVENYIAPVDMEVNGSLILKGTWVLGIKVHDDELWAKAKAGEFTGFSIGGLARSTPV